MIAWMQKHNKYLVVTIWVATIAFIGAGFVGWGTYQYGSRAGSIAKVGEVTISQEKFNFAYQNLYRQFAQRYKGNFDEAKAKKMGLSKMVYRQLASQALLLNLAREYGIVVSDDELAEAIAHVPAFEQNGVFDRKIYETFLESRGMKAKTFEEIFKEDLTIEKLMKLLNQNAVPFEQKVVASGMSVSDKIRYRVLSPSDVNVTVDEAKIKAYWQAHKERYMTPKTYKLALLWTETSQIHADEEELKRFYEKNSFDYTDAQGKELGFERAKSRVERDYKIKKGKKRALLDYIAWKKGKKKASEEREFAFGDATLPRELWQEIETTSEGGMIKPKPVGDRYVTIRVEKVVAPRPMSFEEAKAQVEKDWSKQAKAQALKNEALRLKKSGAQALQKESPWLTLKKNTVLSPLNALESLRFIQKLFTSNEKTGIISVMGKEVVYSIVDQKFQASDENASAEIGEIVDRMKKGEFESALMKELSKHYGVTLFVKGF